MLCCSCCCSVGDCGNLSNERVIMHQLRWPSHTYSCDRGCMTFWRHALIWSGYQLNCSQALDIKNI